jgi:hypothetical protein
VERVEGESLRLGCPCFADELVWSEALEGLQASSEVVCGDEVGEMTSELLMALIMVSFVDFR